MNDEFDDREAVRIMGSDDDASRFFTNMMKDLSILEQIPPGSTIEVVSNQQDVSDPERTMDSAHPAASVVGFGDQIIYILDVPANDHAAD